MPERSIDKRLVRTRFARSAGTYREQAVIQHGMAGRLVDGFLQAWPGACCERVFEAGCGVGTLTRILLERLAVGRLLANDIAGVFRADILRLAADHPDTRIEFLEGDVETIDLPADADLVAANAVFQWLTDLDSFFERLAGRMKPGAALAFTTFGNENLREVAAITGGSLGYRSRDAHRALLERRCFEVVLAWEELAVLRLETPRDVLRHLKATGVNALETGPWRKGDLDRFSAEYGRRFGENGTVVLTYHPLFFVARRKEGP